MDSESERAGRQPGLSRRSLLHGVPLALLGGCSAAAPPSPAPAAPPPKRAGPRFALRLRAEQLRNPFWYEANGDRDAARDFWDMNTWERRLSALAGEGYNAVFYVPEPWQQHAWQTFLIRHDEFPEARDLAVEQYDRLIAQVRRIFRRARDLGLKNFLWSYFSVTTPGFARAHGLDREMPLSESVDQRHNPPAKMGWHFGVRNEITRAFTEAAIAEVFKTYPDLDGLCGAVGEALPGRRSTWYREAIAPGLKRCGRKPLFILDDWMLPLEDFVDDVAADPPYENTWVSIKANGEIFTDPEPYPEALRWADEAGKARMPALFQVMNLNIEANFPFNSPKLAYEVVRAFGRSPNCAGYVSWFLGSNPNTLFRHALGHYGKTAEAYSAEPWVALLEQRYGDRAAAEHLLKAFDASARIPADLCAFAWMPQDIGRSQLLMLPYAHWTLDDPRWGHLTSPARGASLLPLRHYAQVVARHGERFRDNSGADYRRNSEHPGSQELIWGLTRYPVTPEAHVRHLRRLGEACAAEADAALRTVKTNREQAEGIRNYMTAYRLLTVYYEQKVLAAVDALVHAFGGGASARADAERHADAALDRYREAITFIWERIDKKRGQIRGRWGSEFTLPELIENEQAERQRLPELFHWPAKS